MDNPRKALCLSGPFKSFTATPREVACHVTTRVHTIPLLLRGEGPLGDRTEDRRIGLNMNYYFSPETSILLQIIQIIHMTVGIIPESVCQSWLQGDKHNVTPTDKI